MNKPTAQQEQTDVFPVAQYAICVNGNTLRTQEGGTTLSAQRLDGSDITDATELARVVMDAKSAFQAFAAAFGNKAAEHQNAANLMASMSNIAIASMKANDDKAEPKIGYVDAKGWRYVGLSKTTGTRLWVADKDSGIMTWDEAVQFTQVLTDFQGYKGSATNKEIPLAGTRKTIEEVLQKKDDGGVRMPTRAELNQMFKEQKALGDNFGSTDNADNADPWYWSSSEFDTLHAHYQRFSDGCQDYYHKPTDSAVRLVRSEWQSIIY